MAFTVAQQFYVDKHVLGGASEAYITAVDLFYQRKPDLTTSLLTGPRTGSGIYNPGATVFLVPCENSVPRLDDLDSSPMARVEWASINANWTADNKTSTTLVATNFRFSFPLLVSTNQEYAIVVHHDGNDPGFVLWTNVMGYPLLGSSNTASTGSFDRRAGLFYTYVGPPQGQPIPIADAHLQWKPRITTTLAFKIYAARFKVNGNANLQAFYANSSIRSIGEVSVNTAAGEFSIVARSDRYEYCLYDSSLSDTNRVMAGEYCFQNTVFHPGGTSNALASTVSVINGSMTVVGTSGSFNWNTFLNLGGGWKEFVVIVSKDHDGANQDRVVVREVSTITSNTVANVSEPMTFTNTAALFMRTAVGTVDQYLSGRLFGQNQDLLVIRESRANSSIRFVNNAIQAISIANGGTGYANSDYVTITGYEGESGALTTVVLGGYAARANLVTDANGTITTIYLSNAGAGFINTSSGTVSILNSSAANSVGVDANLTYAVGALVKTQFLGQTGNGGFFANCRFINLEVGEDLPRLQLHHPAGTTYKAKHRLPYFSVDYANTSIGKSYRCDPDNAWDEYIVKSFVIHHPWEFTKRRILPSWSNEWNIPYANGTACQAKGGSTGGSVPNATSNSSVLTFVTSSNNDYTVIGAPPSPQIVTFSKYTINESYANEHTNYGNALSKGIEVKVNFANDKFAEDVRVFATVYRPANTEIKMYARVHNSHDPEAFDDKDWTLLELKDGIGVFSSPTDTSNYIELTWGFPQYPNVAFTAVGSVLTETGNSSIVGVGTDWSTNTTANLVANDVVRIYSPLFPENYMVSVVNSVANDTLLVLTDAVTNTGIVGPGMKLDKIAYKHQAFNYVLNDNVARYYNTDMAQFDTYDTVQLKIVMLSDDGLHVPYLDDVRLVGVSS